MFYQNIANLVLDMGEKQVDLFNGTAWASTSALKIILLKALPHKHEKTLAKNL